MAPRWTTGVPHPPPLLTPVCGMTTASNGGAGGQPEGTNDESNSDTFSMLAPQSLVPSRVFGNRDILVEILSRLELRDVTGGRAGGVCREWRAATSRDSLRLRAAIEARLSSWEAAEAASMLRRWHWDSSFAFSWLPHGVDVPRAHFRWAPVTALLSSSGPPSVAALLTMAEQEGITSRGRDGGECLHHLLPSGTESHGRLVIPNQAYGEGKEPRGDVTKSSVR